MLEDVQKIFEALNLQEENLIIFGRSIGSIFAIHFAYKYPNISGLILESALAEPMNFLLQRRPQLVEYLEEKGILQDLLRESQKYLNNKEKLQVYKGPLLIFHTKSDSLVSVRHSEQIYEWAVTPESEKKLIIFENGNHNTIFYMNAESYIQGMHQFFIKLDPKLLEDRKN